MGGPAGGRAWCRAALLGVALLGGCGSQVIGDACTQLSGDLVISEIMIDPSLPNCGAERNELDCEIVVGCGWSDGGVCLGDAERKCGDQDAKGECELAGCMWFRTGSCNSREDEREWFEVYNTSSEPQSLDRMAIVNTQYRADGTFEEHRHNVRGGGVVAPNGYRVLGGGDPGSPPPGYTHAVPDYTYNEEFHDLGLGESFGELSDITDTFVAAEITLECLGRVIDRVRWGQGPMGDPPQGRSVTFDGELAPDDILNDRSQWWCPGGQPYDELGNIGSPGVRNLPCGAVRCEQGGSFRDGVPAAPGELILTEALIDAAGASDTKKYWIEVYVAGGRTVDLNGLSIVTTSNPTPEDPAEPQQAQVTGTACVTGDPGDYLVIAASASAENGGVGAHAEAPGLSFTTPFKDNGGVVELRQLDPETRQWLVIDQAALPPRLGDDSGRSLQECRDGENGVPYTTELDCICDIPAECPDAASGGDSGCVWSATDSRCEGGGTQYSGRSLALDGPAVELAQASALNDGANAFCYSPDSAEGHFDGIGSPGEPNDPCGTVACLDGATYRAVHPPGQASLMITEIYPNPTGTDSNKEWIELLVLQGPVDLNGLEVRNNSTASESSPRRALGVGLDCAGGDTGDYLIVSFLNDQDYAAFLAGGPVLDMGGVSPKLVALTNLSSGFLLGVTSEPGVPGTPLLHVEVAWGGEVLDFAEVYGAGSGVTAMLAPGNLSPPVPALGVNDVPDAWCGDLRADVAEQVFIEAPPFEGLGSPGLPNVCGPAWCFENGVPRVPVSPVVGEVIVNEVYAATSQCGCDATVGTCDAACTCDVDCGGPGGGENQWDWVELVSAALSPWELNSLKVAHVASGSTRVWSIDTPACISVQPGAYVVVAGPNAHLQGVVADATITGPGGSSFFYEGDASLQIRAADDSLLDAAPSHNAENDVSYGLDPAVLFLDEPHVTNDDPAGWCPATSTPPASTFLRTGSPGEENQSCP